MKSIVKGTMVRYIANRKHYSGEEYEVGQEYEVSAIKLDEGGGEIF